MNDTIVMPMYFGGAEHGTDGRLGDLGQRAGWMAPGNATGGGAAYYTR